MLAAAMFVLAWLGWLAIWYIADPRQLTGGAAPQSLALRERYRLLQIFGAAMILLSFLHLLPDLQLWLSEGFAWLMLIALMTGLVFAAWARLHRVDVMAQRLTLQTADEIVRTGPYGIVRNPVLSGLILALLATVIAAGRFDAMIGTALLVRGLVLQVERDEEVLTHRFRPGAYAIYKHDIPMLVPERLQPPEWLSARIVALWDAARKRLLALIGAEKLARLHDITGRHIVQPVRRLADRTIPEKRSDDAS